MVPFCAARVPPQPEEIDNAAIKPIIVRHLVIIASPYSRTVWVFGDL
jgi:hypothetical protein